MAGRRIRDARDAQACLEAVGGSGMKRAELHGGTAAGCRDREGLERLCRFVARPSLASDRLDLLPDGRVRLTQKTPWHDGTTSLLFTRADFVARWPPSSHPRWRTPCCTTASSHPGPTCAAASCRRGHRRLPRPASASHSCRRRSRHAGEPGQSCWRACSDRRTGAAPAVTCQCSFAPSSGHPQPLTSSGTSHAPLPRLEPHPASPPSLPEPSGASGGARALAGQHGRLARNSGRTARTSTFSLPCEWLPSERSRVPARPPGRTGARESDSEAR